MIKHIGLLCAIPAEIGNTIDNLIDISEHNFGDLVIYSGEWKYKKKSNQKKIYISIAWSGWGKVSAARAASRILGVKFKGYPISCIFFTGVAGAIEDSLKQWDIVVASKLVQHDMDARPMFDKYVIPSLKKKFIIPDDNWLNWSLKSLKKASQNKTIKDFGKIYKGLIGTGDKFISDKNSAMEIKKDFKNILAIEMEGASVAQVALQEGIPFQVIRVISDSADESSPNDFDEFITKYGKYSIFLVCALLDNIENAPY